MVAINYLCDEASYPEVCASARRKVPASEEVWTPWVVACSKTGGLVVTVALVQTDAGKWTQPSLQDYDQGVGVAPPPKMWDGTEWINTTKMDKEYVNQIRDWRKTWRVLGTEMPRANDVGMDPSHAIFSNNKKEFFDPKYNCYLLDTAICQIEYPGQPGHVVRRAIWKASASKTTPTQRRPKRRRTEASLDSSHSHCQPETQALELGAAEVCSFQEPALQLTPMQYFHQQQQDDMQYSQHQEVGDVQHQEEGHLAPDFNAADLISLPSLELPSDL